MRDKPQTTTSSDRLYDLLVAKGIDSDQAGRMVAARDSFLEMRSWAEKKIKEIEQNV